MGENGPKAEDKYKRTQLSKIHPEALLLHIERGGMQGLQDSSDKAPLPAGHIGEQ